MARITFSYPRYQAFNNDGTFMNGGTITFYEEGTTTKKNIYSDPNLTTTLPNPITLNSRGEPQSGGGTAVDIYLDTDPYKVVLADSSGTTVHTIDNFVIEQPTTTPINYPDATDQGTDVFEGQLDRDPTSEETFQVDFQSSNTTTTPSFENTDGSLGALTIKARDGSALWPGALNGVHEFYYDGTDYLVLDPETIRGVVEPEHATDSGTDTYDSATNTTPPGDGVKITRDFQSANTTTTPTLDGKTMTDRDGNALWAGAVSGVHDVQYASGTDTYLVLEPLPIDEDDMASDSDAAVPTQQSVKAYTDAGDPTLDTVVDATNGGADDLTEIDFTGIKSGAKRILVVFDGVSLSGTNSILVQIGDSGGVETTGYTSTGNVFNQSGGSGGGSATDGFLVFVGNSSNECYGTMELVNISGNKWVCRFTGQRSGSEVVVSGGVKELSSELDRVRITVTSVDTFDNGTINIMVE